MPKVSIVTVYYNRSYCVDQSVESLLAQSFEDFELLLVNDGSTDTTLKEFEKYTDPRVRIISHENMGFTNSMIRAIGQAQGEYIAVHGSGDISFSKRIELLVNFLDNNPDYVVVSSKFERYDEETLEKIEESPFRGELEFNDFIKNCRIMHGAVMYRKSTYDEAGGYEKFFKTSQDWDLFLRFLKMGKGRIIDEVLYRQYKRRDAVAGKPSSYEKVFKTYALLVKLAIESDRRKVILEEAHKNGLFSVITDENFVYQKEYVSAVTKLVRMGRHVEFLESINQFNAKELPLKLKLKYYSWLNFAKILKLANLDKDKVRGAFSKVKLVKDRVVASIHKIKT